MIPNPFLMASSIRLPLSGDIQQDIHPDFFGPHYNGNEDVEREIIEDVAGYGRQLGWVVEALLQVAEKAEVDLPKIERLHEKSEEIKAKHKTSAARSAAEALESLRQLDQETWKALVAKELEKTQK